MENYENTLHYCSSVSSSSYSSFDSSDDDAVAIMQNNMVLSLGVLVTNLKWPQTRIKIPRDREARAKLLWNDYFSPCPNQPPNVFRRRFRMRRQLFNRIVDGVTNAERYFVQKTDACGVLGLNPYQKVTTAVRMLTYGCATDAIDEYLRIAETTVFEATCRFCKTIVNVYGKEYFREPTVGDVEFLLKQNKYRGFSGMLGSLDCINWKWDKCPAAEFGAYTAYKGSESIVLEAVVSYDLWFWHAFFGVPGSNNDINVMNRSYVFRSLVTGKAPTMRYKVNRHSYDMPYYVVKHPIGRKKEIFTSMQEGARKDVERGFGVLQQQFGIIEQPARMWNPDVLAHIMKTCIILHNMIVEDDRLPGDWPHVYEQRRKPVPVNILRGNSEEFSQIRAEQRRRVVRNKDTHIRLRDDLIEHIWSEYGN